MTQIDTDFFLITVYKQATLNLYLRMLLIFSHRKIAHCVGQNTKK